MFLKMKKPQDYWKLIFLIVMGAPINERFLAKVDAIPHWHSLPMVRVEQESN